MLDRMDFPLFSRNSDASSPDEPRQTATMGARANTSNTSTVGQAMMDTKTATTGVWHHRALINNSNSRTKVPFLNE